jgi:hypothetical protein
MWCMLGFDSSAAWWFKITGLLSWSMPFILTAFMICPLIRWPIFGAHRITQINCSAYTLCFQVMNRSMLSFLPIQVCVEKKKGPSRTLCWYCNLKRALGAFNRQLLIWCWKLREMRDQNVSAETKIYGKCNECVCRQTWLSHARKVKCWTQFSLSRPEATTTPLV